MASAGRRCLVPGVLGILLNALIGELRVVGVCECVFYIFINAGFERTLARMNRTYLPSVVQHRQYECRLRWNQQNCNPVGPSGIGKV